LNKKVSRVVKMGGYLFGVKGKGGIAGIKKHP